MLHVMVNIALLVKMCNCCKSSVALQEKLS